MSLSYGDESTIRVKWLTLPQKTRTLELRCSEVHEVQKTGNDKKSTFSYINMIYIFGKLITCGLRICICFWA